MMLLPQPHQKIRKHHKKAKAQMKIKFLLIILLQRKKKKSTLCARQYHLLIAMGHIAITLLLLSWRNRISGLRGKRLN